MKPSFLILLWVVGLSTSTVSTVSSVTSAYAQSRSEIKKRIESVLQERHPTDTPTWWKRLGPETPSVLLEMANATSIVLHKVRMLEALAYFPKDRAAVVYLKEQAQSADNDVVRNTALFSLGESQGIQESKFLEGFLTHKDAQTRYSAALALQKIVQATQDEKVKQTLERYQKKEKATWILARLQGKQPKALGGSLGPVSTHEDTLNPKFEGKWTGYWLIPEEEGRGKKKGMLAQEVKMDLVIGPRQKVKGHLLIKKMLKDRTGKMVSVQERFDLMRVFRARSEILGKLVKKDSKKKSETLSFKAQLKYRSGAHLIQLEAPKQGVTAVVRREE